mmetsp:Transcript_7045/g.19866  ORF Transcript_7045/g.19866 Transcript_7045/m.19866 type:complete len:242 (-) Transcript_7045:2196-2921(-)
MEASAKRAAVCWTGGKDCNLALLRAHESECFDVVSLVVFHPKDPKFAAHPLEVSRMQAQAVGLPIHFVEVGSEPSFKDSYISGMLQLAEDHGIQVMVTGDIDYVGTMTRNWIEECAEAAGMECWLPLWQQDREALLGEMLRRGFQLVFSCVKSPWFGADDVGQPLDSDRLEALRAAGQAAGLDISGERGEYHTMCLDSPMYNNRVELTGCCPRELHGRPGQVDGQRWWVLDSSPVLKAKAR